MVIPWEGPHFPLETTREAAAESLVRILVIDDEPSLVRSIGALLEGKERLIEDCGSVAEALARLQTRAFDLLILDFRLPDATGLAVMDWLASHGRRESVIMISGERSVEASIGALRRGADDFLLKPYNAEQLRRSVGNALLKRQVERSSRLAQQRLQASERMHRYLVENSLDLIYTLDAEGRFNYINQRIESLLGHRRQALIGRHFSEIVHPEDLEQARYCMNERRTGARATTNLSLRLSRNPCGGDDERNGAAVSIVLNAMGIYEHREGRTPAHYNGTYGTARSYPADAPGKLREDAGSARGTPAPLPSREVFVDRLSLAIAQARRRKSPIAVMQIDLAHLSPLRNEHGQSEGDSLLRAVAQRLRQSLRGGDTLARQGGERFNAILPDIGGSSDAEIIARKILAAFRTPFLLHDGELVLTPSIGIALHPDDGSSAEELIQHASIAAHQVRGTHQHAYCFFTPAMHASYRSRVSFEGELRRAIARNELELHYQPQISLSRNCVTGMEALLRWRHPTHGLVGPSRFIQLAEEAGIIHEISTWVLDTACAQLARWRLQYPALRLSANLSSLDFAHNDLGETVSRALSRNGLPADCLDLEVTESVLLDDEERVSPSLQGLRALGVGIAIDDFGTGHSSLASLKRCGVTRLKIDRSYVKDINVTGNHPVVSAIAGIARGFAIALSAEGVERDDQREVLESLGCDEMQGFLFSRPINADDATRLLREFRPTSRHGAAAVPS